MVGGLSAVWDNADLIAGRRVLHFVDNQAALSTLISGAADDVDSSAVALLYQLALVQSGTRAWLEYVESDANISDGPSRLLDRWSESPLCRSLGAYRALATVPDLRAVLSAGGASHRVFEQLVALLAQRPGASG